MAGPGLQQQPSRDPCPTSSQHQPSHQETTFTKYGQGSGTLG